MRRFIVHNQAGKILRTGRCSDSLFELQAGPGETVIEGTANDETDIITKAGKIKRNARKKPARKKPAALSFKVAIDKKMKAEITAAIATSKTAQGGATK